MYLAFSCKAVVDLNVSISGTVGAKLITRMGMKPETMMSAKQSGTATVGSA